MRRSKNRNVEEKRKVKVSILIPVYNVEEYITQALESIPVKDDIEVVLIDDRSTDSSFDLVLDFFSETDLNMRVYRHYENKGITVTMNDLYSLAEGEYLYQLDSDDCLNTEGWLKAYEQLDGIDMVYVDAQTPTEYLAKHDERNHNRCAAWFYFLRKDYLGSARRVQNSYGGDYEMYLYLISRPHSKKFTQICAYNYNYPRVGSITWKRFNGEL